MLKIISNGHPRNAEVILNGVDITKDVSIKEIVIRISADKKEAILTIMNPEIITDGLDIEINKE